MPTLWKRYKRTGCNDGRFGFSDISTVDEYRDQCREHSRFIDTSLVLFKGELSLNDILYVLPFRRLLELRSARVDRLIEEAKSDEEKQKDRQREMVRNRIMQK